MDFNRASDDELTEAGFDPKWVAELGDDIDGPYVPYRFFNGNCPCCGAKEGGWTVLNIQTATSHSQEFYGDNAECEADEIASMLNRAWKDGRASIQPYATVQQP